jgi:hypothetical protein
MVEQNPIHTPPPASSQPVALPQVSTDQSPQAASNRHEGEDKSDEQRRKDAAARVPSDSDLELIEIQPPAEWIAERNWK